MLVHRSCEIQKRYIEPTKSNLGIGELIIQMFIHRYTLVMYPETDDA